MTKSLSRTRDNSDGAPGPVIQGSNLYRLLKLAAEAVANRLSSDEKQEPTANAYQANTDVTKPTDT